MKIPPRISMVKAIPGLTALARTFLLFSMLVALQLSPVLASTYNFSYHLKGATHGRVLLIIPFRVFYESYASVNLKAEKSGPRVQEFYFDSVPEYGYMMRTSGFSGKTLVILTAGYDLDNSLTFSRNKLNQIDKIAPYYSRYIKRKKPFLFRIFPNDRNAIRFKRSRFGLHTEPAYNFKLRFQYYPEVLNIDFNIYRILLEMSSAFNHPFVPGKDLEAVRKNPKMVWQSPPLDYSTNINRIVRLAARVMKRLKRFRQERPFRLTYRLESQSVSRMVIKGSANPMVPIWDDYVISDISRIIVLRPNGHDLIEDSFKLKIEDPEGKGLEAQIALKRID